jgi:hypothetical protein
MAATIQIKHSSSSGPPPSLAEGEMAYSYLLGTQTNGGDRLYIGTVVGTFPNAVPTIEVIGGKYFTAKLDHTPGVLTANSAIITDASNKISGLNVDNITIDGNAISATNTNGNIVLNPNGTGFIDASGARIIDGGYPVLDNDFATKAYVDNEIFSIDLTLEIAGDTGTGTILLTDEVLTISGGIGLSSAVLNNTITINLDNTTVTAGSYGSANTVATFTVDSQGRITAAANATIAIPSTQVTNFTEAVQDVVGTFTSANTTQGIIVTYTDESNTLQISAYDATATQRGVSSFGGWADSANTARQFSVTTGDVQIINLDGGEY